MVTNSVKRMTHFLSASVAIALTLGLSGCGGDAATNTDVEAVDTSTTIDDWRLVWSDEFDGSGIDASKWTHEVNCEGGGNQEQQCYTDSPDNSFVSDGTLKIVAKPSTDGEALPYTSARMVTKNKGDWTYGRFEMRAKMPFGQGSWPAFWMLSTDEVYGDWPKSGEIDILETVNLKEIDANGDAERSIVGTLYYGSGEANANNQFDSSGKTFDLLDGSNPADDFHTYAIEWQAGEIRWYVDDYLYATQRKSTLKTNSRGEVLGLTDNGRGWYAELFDQVTGELQPVWGNAPFDQDFHILLNLAVGGAFPANTNNAANFPNGIDPAAFANGQTYEIDYVRVYKCDTGQADGAGCENIRNGYNEVATEENPTGALVLGVAPTPIPPVGPARGIVIFEDEELEGWPLWDDSNNTTPMVVIDEDETYGAVAEFEIVDNAGTVLGFNSRLSEDQKTFNATGIADGTISFDMKVVSAPAGTDNWLLKVEADGGANRSGTGTGDLLFLQNSIEGQFPVEGVWQTYTFTLQSLVEAGLELGLIDLVMIFPEFGKGEGAVYRVDNVKFEVAGDGGGGVEARTEVFYDDALADGLSYDSFNPDGFVSFNAELAEDGRGNVIEVVKTGATGNFYFVGPDGGFDLSSWEADGDLVFDLNVSSLDAGVELYVKFDSGWPNVSDYSVMLPTTGEWATIRIPVADILANGNTFGDGTADPFNLTNVFVVEPTGVMTFKLDNVRLDIEGAGSTPTIVETFYTDALADGLSYDSFNPDGFVSFNAELAEDGRGNVIEVVKTGATGNFYFVGPDGGFDLSSFEDAGELVFDLNVSSLDAGVELYVKFDSGWPNVSDYSVTLPTTGQWATIRIPVADILANGNTFGDGTADPFNLTNVFVAEPTGVMTFKLDNVRLEIPGTDAPAAETEVVMWYEDGLADGLSFDSFNPDGVVSASEINEDGFGTILQVVKTGANGNYYIVAPDGGFDLSSFEDTGELVFNLNVVSSDGGVELYVKFDSGWPNVSDYSVPLPNIGEWAEIRVSVAEILANGNTFGDGTADPFNLTNLFVVEPTGVMTFKLDNIRLEK